MCEYVCVRAWVCVCMKNGVSVVNNEKFSTDRNSEVYTCQTGTVILAINIQHFAMNYRKLYAFLLPLEAQYTLG